MKIFMKNIDNNAKKKMVAHDSQDILEMLFQFGCREDIKNKYSESSWFETPEKESDSESLSEF